ncbi:MAG: HEAT repeat domain-containing protein [Planctomycetaceae bacterium]|nr:HEAT repeat domain-containing protein [Planctomycetaceae bacterium]
MKRTPLIVVLVGLVAGLLAIWLEPTGIVLGRLTGEPFLGGRPLRYWSSALNGGPAENAAALEALAAADKSEAEPMLAALYQSGAGDDRAEQRWTSLELLAGQAPLGEAGQEAMVEALEDPDAHVRSIAIAALPKTGVAADRGVTLLMKHCDGEQAVVAARAISEYRGAAAAALPVLVELMQNEEASVEARWNAVRTIGKIGPDALPALPALIDELDNPEDTIREHAAEAIGDIGPVAAEAGVPALRGVLGDHYVKVRRDAVRSLGYIGPPAAAAVDDILPLLDDPEEIVRVATRDAVKKIAPERLPAESAP